MDIYTHETWENDWFFNAAPGQEVEESVYDSMNYIVNSFALPDKAWKVADRMGIRILTGFMMGEQAGIDDYGVLYHAFVYGVKDAHDGYFYIGKLHKQHKDTDQRFYFTYGSSESHPYQGGYTLVIAKNKASAVNLFCAVHPKRNGFLTCAFVYDENEFKPENFGEKREEIKLNVEVF